MIFKIKIVDKNSARCIYKKKIVKQHLLTNWDKLEKKKGATVNMYLSKICEIN